MCREETIQLRQTNIFVDEGGRSVVAATTNSIVDTTNDYTIVVKS